MYIREAEFLQKAAEISFSHEIAQAWISLAAQKEQVEIIAQSIARQRKALQLYKSMVNTGGGRECNSGTRKPRLPQVIDKTSETKASL